MACHSYRCEHLYHAHLPTSISFILSLSILMLSMCFAIVDSIEYEYIKPNANRHNDNDNNDAVNDATVEQKRITSSVSDVQSIQLDKTYLPFVKSNISSSVLMTIPALGEPGVNFTNHFCGDNTLACPLDAPICCGTAPFLYCVAAGTKCCGASSTYVVTNCAQDEECCASRNAALCCPQGSHCVFERNAVGKDEPRCSFDDVCSSYNDADSCLNDKEAQREECGWCCEEQRCISAYKTQTFTSSSSSSSSTQYVKETNILIPAQAQSEFEHSTSSSLSEQELQKEEQSNEWLTSPEQVNQLKLQDLLHAHNSVNSKTRTTCTWGKAPIMGDEECPSQCSHLSTCKLCNAHYSSMREAQRSALTNVEECVWCCATMTCMSIRDLESKCANYEYVDTINRCQGCMYNGSGTDALYISGKARIVLLISTISLFIGVITVLSVIMYLIFTFTKWQEERTMNARLVNAQETVRRYGFKFLPNALSTRQSNVHNNNNNNNNTVPHTQSTQTQPNSDVNNNNNNNNNNTVTTTTTTNNNNNNNNSSTIESNANRLRSHQGDNNHDERGTVNIDTRNANITIWRASNDPVNNENVNKNEDDKRSNECTCNVHHSNKLGQVHCSLCHRQLNLSHLYSRLWSTRSGASPPQPLPLPAIAPHVASSQSTWTSSHLQPTSLTATMATNHTISTQPGTTPSRVNETHQGWNDNAHVTSSELPIETNESETNDDDAVALLLPCNHILCYPCIGVKEQSCQSQSSLFEWQAEQCRRGVNRIKSVLSALTHSRSRSGQVSYAHTERNIPNTHGNADHTRTNTDNNNNNNNNHQNSTNSRASVQRADAHETLLIETTCDTTDEQHPLLSASSATVVEVRSGYDQEPHHESQVEHYEEHRINKQESKVPVKHEKVEKRVRRFYKNKCPVCKSNIEDIMLTQSIYSL